MFYTIFIGSLRFTLFLSNWAWPSFANVLASCKCHARPLVWKQCHQWTIYFYICHGKIAWQKVLRTNHQVLFELHFFNIYITSHTPFFSYSLSRWFGEVDSSLLATLALGIQRRCSRVLPLKEWGSCLMHGEVGWRGSGKGQPGQGSKCPVGTASGLLITRCMQHSSSKTHLTVS